MTIFDVSFRLEREHLHNNLPTDPTDDNERRQGGEQEQQYQQQRYQQGNQNSPNNFKMEAEKNVLKSDESRVVAADEERPIKFETSRNERFANRRLMNVADETEDDKEDDENDEKTREEPNKEVEEKSQALNRKELPVKSVLHKDVSTNKGNDALLHGDVSSKLVLQPVNEQVKKSQQEDSEKTPEEILNSPVEVEKKDENVPEKSESVDSHDNSEEEEHTVNIELRPKKSYEVEDDGLPNNQMENGFRNRPINVPEFQVGA